ncbi:MAG TPA: translation initiation factor IF-2, partial [Thiotrichales bacterium]|nr:translation initiation factor IF-2 [Thiotrichales bacterium]
MAEVTVKQLASVVGTPVERLLEQIKDAGLSADNPDSLISDEDKMQLLAHLRGLHGKGGTEAKAKKIALKRKSVSELKVGSGSGKTVAVEVRRKRTITRPVETAMDDAATSTETPEELSALEKLRADQARREAEREAERELKRKRAEERQQAEREEAER